MDIIKKIKEELKVEKWQVEAAVKLIDEGNTIPFISRYRKEATGSLNDEQLRDLYERLNYLRNLEEKKEQVLGSIEEQGQLTEELKAKILTTPLIEECDFGADYDMFDGKQPEPRQPATAQPFRQYVFNIRDDMLPMDKG